MGLFKKEQELGIDIGSHNIRIVNSEGEVILDERSLVAIDDRSNGIICVGDVTNISFPPNRVQVVAPYKKGEIVDIHAFNGMFKAMVEKARYRQSNKKWDKGIENRIINEILIFAGIIISLPYLIVASIWDEIKGR